MNNTVAPPTPICQWNRTNREDQMFFLGMPACQNPQNWTPQIRSAYWKFCPYCGRLLVVKEKRVPNNQHFLLFANSILAAQKYARAQNFRFDEYTIVSRKEQLAGLKCDHHYNAILIGAWDENGIVHTAFKEYQFQRSRYAAR